MRAVWASAAVAIVLSGGCGGSGSPGSSITQPNALGLVRLDRSGAVTWSKELPNSQGAAFEHLAVAVTPLGNVYVVGRIECGLDGGGCSFDAGGGAVSGSVLLKFQPPGAFAWQRSLEGALSSNVAVDIAP